MMDQTADATGGSRRNLSDVEAYGSFIEQNAPYGYALIFVRTGDFPRAQQALRQAFVDGFEAWRSRRSSVTDPAELMAGLVDAFGKIEEEAPSATSSSLSRSRKLQALEEALEILRSFPEPERLALVLLQVEEIAEPQVLAWLGRDRAFLDEVRLRLEKRLAGWAPPGGTGEDAKEFFMRALRQYRLSAHFGPAVLHQLDRFRATPWTGLRRVAGWVILLLLPLFFLEESREFRFDDPPEYGHSRQAWAGPGLLFFDLLLTLLAFLARRFLVVHAPPALAQGSAKHLAPLLDLLGMAGGGFVISALSLGTGLGLSWRGSGIPWWILFHETWMVGTLCAVVTAFYLTVVHYLKRFDDQDPARRGGRTP